MATRTSWRPAALCLAGLMVAAALCGTGYPQSKPALPSQDAAAPPSAVAAAPSELPSPPPTPVSLDAVAPEPPPAPVVTAPIAGFAPPSAEPATVEMLIVRLERLRSQKAELERQEKEVAIELRRLLKQQQARLDMLGISAVESPAPPPASPEPRQRRPWRRPRSQNHSSAGSQSTQQEIPPTPRGPTDLGAFSLTRRGSLHTRMSAR
jgi:hypothetical protein